MGLELMGQSVYYYYRPLCDVFGDKRLWVLVGGQKPGRTKTQTTINIWVFLKQGLTI